jgi:uncharacterized protein (DUF2344 family)
MGQRERKELVNNKCRVRDMEKKINRQLLEKRLLCLKGMYENTSKHLLHSYRRRKLLGYNM